MRRRLFVLACSLWAIGTSSAITGCGATMADVFREHRSGGGTSVVYDIPLNDAYDIGRTVFEWEVGEHIELHRDEGYLVTSTDVDMFKDATLMGAWFEEAGGGKTKVTVVTKRRNPFQMTTTLTERTFHRRFAQALAIVESGESLPEDPPPRFVSPVKRRAPGQNTSR
jgi:hypothetical protein